VEGPRERYHLDWPGKREALLAANTPIAKTLRPCRKESVDFDTTKNLFIEGDNLDALKLLQETYLGKVRMIYIDPPYNTGSDLLYEDDFGEPNSTFQRRSEQRDEIGNRLVANLESNGRFHSDWLSMIYPRIKLARNLLTESGAIFVSIGDDEVCNLKKLCDEVFGEHNFVSQVTRIAKRTSDKGTHFRPTKDHVLVYAKDIALLPEFGVKKNPEEGDYSLVDEGGRKYKKSGASLYQPSLDSRPNQRYYIEAPDGSLIIPPGNVFPDEKKDASKVKPLSNGDKVWRWSVDTYLAKKHLLIFTEGSAKNPLLDENGKQSKWNIYPKVFFDDDTEATLHPEDVIYEFPNSQGTKELNALSVPFSFAKPTGLIAFLLGLLEGKDAVVVDLFAGSSTTAHAVMKLNAEDNGNRRFIMVQFPEPCDDTSEASKAGYATIDMLSKERIRRAGKQLKEENATNAPSLDVGFRVLKIDTSNMADVYYAPDAVKQTDLVAHTDNIQPDRTPEDLLFQVLVDWGVDLSLPIAQETVAGKKVFFVDGNTLAACFDPKVSEDLVKELAKRKPLRAVFRDSSYDSDSVKINVEQIFKLLSPETEVKSL
jgi:adenine-specific DNA-methyltransferase